jgi:hypothetical protein
LEEITDVTLPAACPWAETSFLKASYSQVLISTTRLPMIRFPSPAKDNQSITRLRNNPPGG